ncbi:MAG: hypothetical protein PHE01_04265 [Methanosarcina sp.]|nr:hypothetical protein [Methanosarcina sp.]
MHCASAAFKTMSLTLTPSRVTAAEIVNKVRHTRTGCWNKKSECSER